MPETTLCGRRILIVEDEALIAMEMEWALADLGAIPAGPAPNVRAAAEIAATASLDGAVLDINLRGEEVFPVANILFNRKIPFVFQTGHGRRDDLERRYPGTVVFLKPASSEAVGTTLAGLIEDRETAKCA